VTFFHCRRRWLSFVVAVVVGCVLLGVLPTPARAGVGVGPNPMPAQYVVTGAVLLDSSFTGGLDRRLQALSCIACEWATTPPCFDVSPSGINQICGLHGVFCPPGYTYLRVWFRESAAFAWAPVGLICSRTTRLTPVADVVRAVRIRRVPVPPLRPTSQPSRRALTGLPVWFAVGQPRSITRHVAVLGWNVTLVAAPRWLWSFGDGSTLPTQDPGGRYPVGTLRHTYGHRGRVTINVTAAWSAQWRVSDLPFVPVNGSLYQVRGLSLDVRPAQAVLVPTR